jgi:hypothetical protein
MRKERGRMLKWSASGDPDLAGDVGVLSLLAEQVALHLQFGHTLVFSLSLNCWRNACCQINVS